jgi:hypothetical protein
MNLLSIICPGWPTIDTEYIPSLEGLTDVVVSSLTIPLAIFIQSLFLPSDNSVCQQLLESSRWIPLTIAVFTVSSFIVGALSTIYAIPRFHFWGFWGIRWKELILKGYFLHTILVDILRGIGILCYATTTFALLLLPGLPIELWYVCAVLMAIGLVLLVWTIVPQTAHRFVVGLPVALVVFSLLVFFLSNLRKPVF